MHGSQSTKEAVWTEIVTEKYENKRKHWNTGERRKRSYYLLYLNEITWNDGTNREGHAAKVYFNALFGLDFTRTADIPVNAALNYGIRLFFLRLPVR